MMKEDNWFVKLIKRLGLGKQPSPGSSQPAGETARATALLQMLEGTDEVELSCDEVFALLDQYVEMEARGEDAALLLPLVKRHLDKCRDCHEEYQALSLFLAANSEK